MQRSSISGSSLKTTSPRPKEKTSGFCSRRSRRAPVTTASPGMEPIPPRKRRSAPPPATMSRWAESPSGSSGPPRRTARKRATVAAAGATTPRPTAAAAPSTAPATTTTTTATAEMRRLEAPSAVGTRYLRVVGVGSRVEVRP